MDRTIRMRLGPVVLATAFGASALILAAPAQGLIWDSLRAFADVSRVDSRTDHLDRETWRQEYSLNWNHTLVPYVTLGASLRYYKFDLDADLGLSSWREELQPAGEIAWKHPWFVLSASGFRRRASASFATGNIITDNVLVALNSRDTRYPLVGLRYDWQHIVDAITGDDRDIRDRRLQLTADYTAGNHTFSYNFAHRFTDNVVSGLQSTQDSHLLRWNGFFSPLESDRLRISSHYTFSRVSRNDEVMAGGTLIEAIPIASGLHAEDPSPEVGPLNVVAGLTDGNTSAPTQPSIDIGGPNVDHNLGADLGFARLVSALYVYTDRASGPQPSWRVYVSTDNLVWELADATPRAGFNVGLSRYEIVFDTVETRFVKVVNGGFNDVAQVLVTEIQAFQEIRETDTLDTTRNSHLLDGRVSYDVTERLDAALDFSYQRQPGVGGVGTRQNVNYAASGRYRQSTSVSHHLRWEQSFQDFDADDEDLMEYVASYALLAEPLETITGNLSLSSRHDYLGPVKDRMVNSALAEVNGTPVTGLGVSLQAGLNRSELYLLDRTSDTWTYRVSADGAITRSLDAIASLTYQEIRFRPGEDRFRHFYTFGFDYRVTRTIFGRGTININEDVVSSTRQEYFLSWNVVPKLTLGAQIFLTNAAAGAESDRYNVSVHYDMTRRISLYSNLTLIDFSQAGGTQTRSFQLGVRAAL